MIWAVSLQHACPKRLDFDKNPLSLSGSKRALYRTKASKLSDVEGQQLALSLRPLLETVEA
jgi:hypothetical protein